MKIQRDAAPTVSMLLMRRAFAALALVRPVVRLLSRAPAPNEVLARVTVLVPHMRGAFAMHGVVRMQRGLAGAVRRAHEWAKLEPIVLRNLAPAFATLMSRGNRVEALTTCVGDQVRVFQ